LCPKIQGKTIRRLFKIGLPSWGVETGWIGVPDEKIIPTSLLRGLMQNDFYRVLGMR